MLCTASNTFRILGYLQLYLLNNIQLYSSIFTIIKTDSDILMYDQDILSLIQAYSEGVNQYLCHSVSYKQIQIIRRNQVYFCSSNVSTYATVIINN